MTRKQEREYIYNKYDGHCAYCGEKLKEGWHVDHMWPLVRNIESDGCMNPQWDTIENKMPACPSCNINKHSLDIEKFRDLIQGFVNSLNKRSTQYKMIKKYGLIEETGKPVKFYFEQCHKR